MALTETAQRTRPTSPLPAVMGAGSRPYMRTAQSTAATAMGARAPGWLESLAGYEAEVVYPAGRGWCSAGFDALRLRPGVP